VPAGSISVWV
jgi:dTDP-4-amino-4,6-dideoxygalactose transaminase